MKDGTIVLIFNTYELMKDNIVNLIAQDKFRKGKVFATITRNEGHSVIYASCIETNKTVTSRPEMMVSKYGEYFIPLTDVQFFVDKYFEDKLKNAPDLRENGTYSKFIKLIKDKLNYVPEEKKNISLDHDHYS